MYPNLNAEMARRKLTWTYLASRLGIRLGTMSQKQLGKVPFTLDEAIAIKAVLEEVHELDMPLEELFKREDV